MQIQEKINEKKLIGDIKKSIKKINILLDIIQNNMDSEDEMVKINAIMQATVIFINMKEFLNMDFDQQMTYSENKFKDLCNKTIN